MATTYVTQDVYDHVLDSLAGDKSSLASCALVCRDWLPASRHRLLMDVWLNSHRRYNLFVSNVVRSPTVSRWLPSIRQLTLDSSRYMTSTDGHVNMRMASERLFMHQLRGRLPKLEELELHDQNWDTRECSIPPRMFVLLSAFASVWALVLDNVRFPSSGTMRCTITALPSLTDLRIRHVTWPVSRGIRPLRGTRKSQFLKRIRRFSLIRLNGHCEEEILEWLPVTSLGTSLVDLQIDSTALTNGSELWEFVGPSVIRLVTDFWHDREELQGDSTLH